MHANEIVVERVLAERLIKKQFSQWKLLFLEQISSAGTDNTIYRLGPDLAVRFPRIPTAVQQIDKEFEWLPRIAPHISLAIPAPVAKGMPDEGYPWPWLVYRWLGGENAMQASIDLHQVADALGEFVTQLHNVPVKDAPPAGRGAGLLSVRDQEVRVALSKLHGIIDVEAAASMWEQVCLVPAWSGEPAWIHSDLHGGNILITEGNVTAVIDFGMAGIGDPACDVMVAWTLLSTQTRDVFREIIQADDAMWARGQGWALSFGLIALPYYKDSNQVLANIALRTINEVLSDRTIV